MQRWPRPLGHVGDKRNWIAVWNSRRKLQSVRGVHRRVNDQCLTGKVGCHSKKLSLPPEGLSKLKIKGEKWANEHSVGRVA